MSAVFTSFIVALAGRLGPVLAGLIDALPAMSLMMAFTTHQDHGSGASSRFLHGVTRGSFSYLAAMIVLAELLRTGDLSSPSRRPSAQLSSSKDPFKLTTR